MIDCLSCNVLIYQLNKYTTLFLYSHGVLELKAGRQKDGVQSCLAGINSTKASKRNKNCAAAPVKQMCPLHHHQRPFADLDYFFQM